MIPFRKINEIFVDMGSYSRETHPFLEELKVLKPEVLPTESADCIADFAGKINGINEVLARDHMKVAFFGRTSNGKSTVINAMLHSKILPSGMRRKWKFLWYYLAHKYLNTFCKYVFIYLYNLAI